MSKPYNTEEEDLTAGQVNEENMIYLINTMRKGIQYNTFNKIAENSPFTLDEWSDFLHISGRTIQRYKKEKKTFDPIHAERILEITLLYNKGIEVFGKKDKFDAWLDIKSVALGGIKPKELLDSSFGIRMLSDELMRIAHGILA